MIGRYVHCISVTDFGRITSPVSNPVHVIHCRLSVLVDILFYLSVRHVDMCSVPKNFRLFLQLSLAPDAFLVPECQLDMAPNVMEVAYPCK